MYVNSFIAGDEVSDIEAVEGIINDITCKVLRVVGNRVAYMFQGCLFIVGQECIRFGIWRDYIPTR